MKKIFAFCCMAVIAASAFADRCKCDVERELSSAKSSLAMAKDAFNRGIQGSEANVLYYERLVEQLESELRSTPSCASVISDLKERLNDAERSSYNGTEGSYTAYRARVEAISSELNRHERH